MILLGLTVSEKRAKLTEYASQAFIKSVVMFGPPRFRFETDLPVPIEHVTWDQIIEYKFFYRLLQEINRETLLVFNECLRTPERNSLHYNCLRNYLTRTPHQLVLNRFPALESPDDLMILVDLDTSSRWRRSKLSDVTETVRISVCEVTPRLTPVQVAIDPAVRARYAREKRILIDTIGQRDPHTIPRRLHLLAGPQKAKTAAEMGGLWVGRNGRLKVPGLVNYDDATEPRRVFEFCHSYRDWSDYLTASESISVEALVSDLKVDLWYLDRFRAWTETQHNAYTAIRRHLGT